MGLGPDAFNVGAWDVEKSKGRKKKDEENEMTGCWFKFRFIGSCMSSKSKVDGSMSGTSTQYAESKSTNDTSQDQPVAPVVSSSTTSIAESTPSTPNLVEDLKVASQLRKFSFNELKSSTRNFRPESLLGEGGFGCVFKGWINENGTAPVKTGTGVAVAVKTLNHDGLQGSLPLPWSIRMKVALGAAKGLAFLHEEAEKPVIYRDFKTSNILLDAVMKVALGAAKGLAFLHEEAEKPVIYRDFKTSNILLDADYNAKLSDFGLAKDGPEDGKTHVSTRVMGTYGYAAPEYVMTDPRLEGRFSVKGSQKALQLAAHCLSPDPKARPLMSEVVEALKPLPNLKEMACSSSFFQAMQAERMGSYPNARNCSRIQTGFSRNGQPTRSLSIPNGPHVSPYHHHHLHRSPKPRVWL
ncbi:putative serine/threonine-protein kinase pix7 [Quercus suber]|uniref:Serine/threonine-protein kinase pix7 n=1 Tax=Quercus suber TaxID=58331 RepID=A0AAW0MCF9_QUESU